MNTLSHQTLKESIVELENELDGIEPTDEQLQKVFVPNDKLEIAWCGGSKSRGCGNKFNLFFVRYENGFAVCPYCGKLN